MLICPSCNIEYKEDKKYCNFCGNPLVEGEDLSSSPGDINGEEKSGLRPICPNCKISYEFGTSCIQCGSPLVSQIPAQAKGDLNTAPEPPLVPQTSTLSKEEAQKAFGNRMEEEELFQKQKNQEDLVKVSRKNLICPNCRILYERGDSCIRCGAALLTQLPFQEEDGPELSKPPEVTPATPPTENLGLPPTQEIPAGPSGASEASHPPVFQANKIGVDIEKAAFPERIGQESAIAKQIKKEEPARSQPSELIPIKKITDDYRRLLFKVGSISILVMVGGYLLWSIYSRSITKRPDPEITVSRETASQIQSDSSISIHHEGSVSGQGEPTPVSASPSLPDSSKILSDGNQEIEKIKNLLENIRQANIKKDIDLFLSCYAADFKDREGKKKTTLAHWQNFDYLDLSYELKTPSISGDVSKARVEWLIKISPKTGGQPQESRTILDVTLKKEDGGWKIKEVKPIG